MNNGTPFVPDLCKLLTKDKYSLFLYNMSDATLLNYATNEVIELRKHSVKRISYVLSSLRIKKILCNIDILHFHGTKDSQYFILKALKNISDLTVGHVWGSEFYKIDKQNILSRVMLKLFYKNLNRILFTNEQTLNDFKRLRIKTKSNVLSYPLLKLDLIKIGKAQSRKFHLNNIGIDSDKPICCIGYNASTFQNHHTILDAIDLDNKFKSKYHFIFPLTYSGSIEYKQSIIERLKSSNYDFTVFEKYISDSEVVSLRLVSDTFIQVQDTDQFSGSMQESFYAGSAVLTGKWLPYSILRANGIVMSEIDSLKDLAIGLSNLELLSKSKDNPNIIYSLSGPSSLIPKWESFYDTEGNDL